jgi:CRISPR-associated protein Csb2
LRLDNGRLFSYPQDRLIHIAGMVRHLAIEAMERSRSRDVDEDWVKTYVAGHARAGGTEHRQFSYLPLPSIGHAQADQSVRRVMIAAPLGGDQVLLDLAMLLDGQQLRPTPETKLDHPPTLVRVRGDKVARFYTQSANAWASVTPVILPGHDDQKPGKTRKLVEKALAQSGVEQQCEFEVSPFSYFRKSLSAHKYGRDKRPCGYIRPDHLLTQSAVHLKLRFTGALEVPGPLVIGAGRHCGFGLMAGVDR